MMKSKKLKSGLSLLGIAVICTIVGYTIWIPGGKQSEKENPIAVMLQSGNDWIQAPNSSFTQDGYEYDHASCINGSTVTSGENGISIRLTGTDKCTLYYKKEADIKITGITVNGVSQTTVPTQAKYTVTPTCTGATAEWNYASWSLNVTALSQAKASCSLEFTSPTSLNYLNSYIVSNVGTTQGETSTQGQIVNEGLATVTSLATKIYSALSAADDYGTAQYNSTGGQISNKYTFSTSTKNGVILPLCHHTYIIE